MTSLSHPALSLTDAQRRERTADLLGRAHGAAGEERDALLDEVVTINLRVAHAIARRFKGRGIPIEDLEQVAALALVRAAARFDVAQERDFLTYAVPSMSGEIKRHFRDLGWTIRPPRRIQEIQARALDLHDAGHPDGTPMSVDEIAEALSTTPEDVAEALAAQGLFHPGSLDLVASGASGEGRLTVAELMAADDPEPDRLEARVVLEPVLRKLSERDRRILYLRFHEEQSQAEIGDQLGVSQMRVSRLLRRILDDLRDELEPSEPSGPSEPEPARYQRV